MIPRATLSRIDRPVSNGRTGPLHAVCESEDGEEFEIVLKLSAGCDEGVTNLAREAIAACAAADLGLPVPKPWLVELPPAMAAAVSDRTVADRLKASCPIAFGSTRVSGFQVWNTGQRLSEITRPVAAAILLFDAIIQNVDRRAGNPNCLVRGTDFRIFDHELAFMHRLVLGWKPPWQLGGLGSLETPGNHIFVGALKGFDIDFEPIKSRWAHLSDERLREYANAVPPEWDKARAEVRSAVKLLADARDNMAACVLELRRVLS